MIKKVGKTSHNEVINDTKHNTSRQKYNIISEMGLADQTVQKKICLNLKIKNIQIKGLK